MKNNPKKQQIVKAALKRFVRHGLAKTTVEEIARDLRIGKATVYHYFASKEDIFFEVLRTENERYLENIAQVCSNPDLPAESRIVEYNLLKSTIRDNYPLLNELIFLIINEKATEKEQEVFRYLVEREESLLAETVKDPSKKNADSTAVRALVLQSYSQLFTSALNRSLLSTDNNQ